MKSLSAFELFLKIRQKYFPNELPIMFVCAQKTKDEKVLEANDYLTRPIDADELRARARNLVYIKESYLIQ